jgi:hypothetical protein
MILLHHSISKKPQKTYPIKRNRRLPNQLKHIRRIRNLTPLQPLPLLPWPQILRSIHITRLPIPTKPPPQISLELRLLQALNALLSLIQRTCRLVQVRVVWRACVAWYQLGAVDAAQRGEQVDAGRGLE